MKEFIEKLIGRLEELKTFKLDLADTMLELMKKDRLDNYISKEEAISIVNQLAEEYNNDFCEWKFETTGIVWHCNGCETYNLPYAMNLRIIADDFECKCPHCGKKIKVVE